jgi:hypothetical protein
MFKRLEGVEEDSPQVEKDAIEYTHLSKMQ